MNLDHAQFVLIAVLRNFKDWHQVKLKLSVLTVVVF